MPDKQTTADKCPLNVDQIQVTMDDFTKAKEKALYRKKGNIPEGLYL
ncbi:unnamed protein product [Discosporangium mesarthrocarpum]